MSLEDEVRKLRETIENQRKYDHQAYLRSIGHKEGGYGGGSMRGYYPCQCEYCKEQERIWENDRR